MNCSKHDVRNRNIRLCYDGKNGTRCAILIVLRLIVYHDTWGRRRWYRRHWRLLKCTKDVRYEMTWSQGCGRLNRAGHLPRPPRAKDQWRLCTRDKRLHWAEQYCNTKWSSGLLLVLTLDFRMVFSPPAHLLRKRRANSFWTGLGGRRPNR